MQGVILILLFPAVVVIAHYYGRKIGQCEAYDEAFKDVISLYEEVLAEERVRC